MLRLPAGFKGPLREVFLVLPGLNLAPHKLEPIILFLLGQGCAVVQPPLRGYSLDPGRSESGQAQCAEDWACVSSGDWLADLDHAWHAVRGKYPAAQPSLVGYSMGALLGLTWSLTRGVPLRRAVLIAPALRLKWHLEPALRVLGAVLPRAWRLPSLGAPDYLMHRGTSLAAYGALVDLLRLYRNELIRLGQPGGTLPPRFLAYSPRDEMISTRYLDRERRPGTTAITHHNLAHGRAPGNPRHLAIDAHTLGRTEWAALLAALGEWLRQPLPQGALHSETKP